MSWSISPTAKQADEEQKILIDELNHRVKNTLATVQSISMHTHRSTPEAFVERFEDQAGRPEQGA